MWSADELFALLWFTLAPVSCLCWQYGWDMIMDAVVPVHPQYQED